MTDELPPTDRIRISPSASAPTEPDGAPTEAFDDDPPRARSPLLPVLALALAILALLYSPGLVGAWVQAAKGRLAYVEAAAEGAEAQKVAVAAAADEEYCTPELKRILRRVLQSCGLLSTGETRGCQPLEARSVAALSGPDFNALFLPLEDRAGIVQFDKAKEELDEADKELLERLFADQRGASWFFVVSRASPDGSPDFNRQLSRRRAEAVLAHLRAEFDDPDLDKELGLLWLGEEFAQLDDTFCSWQRSGDAQCKPEELNRSAFVAWIDCRL